MNKQFKLSQEIAAGRLINADWGIARMPLSGLSVTPMPIWNQCVKMADQERMLARGQNSIIAFARDRDHHIFPIGETMLIFEIERILMQQFGSRPIII